MNWDSSKFDQSSLALRSEPTPFAEFVYKVRETKCLHSPRSHSPHVAFLRSRRTHRSFGQISHEKTYEFLNAVAMPSSFIDSEFGRAYLNPAPSAGARHPIDILVVDPIANSAAVYLPTKNCINYLETDAMLVQTLYREARELVNPEGGVLVWLVAQPGRTMVKYDNAESFVMFDAGSLVATMSFVAHALELAYCPLGISGEPTISRLLHSQGQAIGLIGGILGVRI